MKATKMTSYYPLPLPAAISGILAIPKAFGIKVLQS